MTGIAEFLGDLRGREVLELGNGMGEMTTLLARSGARVTAVDISPASIAVARRRAELHGVGDSIEFVVAAGEQLPLRRPTASTSSSARRCCTTWTSRRAAPELHRVLRPGGRAAFAEPLGTNPVVAFARDHLPYPGKNPRGADVPLSYADIRAWEAPFARRRAPRGPAARDGPAGARARPAARACGAPTTGCWTASRHRGGCAATSF